MRSRWRGGFDPQQHQIDWSDPKPSAPTNAAEPVRPAASPPLALTLKWDFRTSFPEPTEQALAAGVIRHEECDPESIAGIHQEHSSEMLATLHDLDAVLDARRRGVDPATDKAPRTEAQQKRLQQLYESEPPRLERWFANLLGTYEDAFGADAAEAFGKAVRAWHAGVETVAESTKPLPIESAPKPYSDNACATSQASQTHTLTARGRARHCLPVPSPLPAAVQAGHFGLEETGKPVRPGAAEVREITRAHADKLIDLLDQLRSAPLEARGRLQSDYAAGITAYAEDFGPDASKRLEAYVQREAMLDPGRRQDR
jgi:hypothetical protein